MRRQAIGFLVAIGCAADAGAAATASGRNWRLAIESLECEGARRARHEDPLPRAERAGRVAGNPAGGREGRQHPPRAWCGGRRQPADRRLARRGAGWPTCSSEDVGEVQLKFELPEASGALQLRVRRHRGFALTRKGSRTVCEGLLKPERIRTPRQVRPTRAPEGRIEPSRLSQALSVPLGVEHAGQRRSPVPALPAEAAGGARPRLSAQCKGDRAADGQRGGAVLRLYRNRGHESRWSGPRCAPDGRFPAYGNAHTSPSTGGCSARRAATSSIRRPLRP